MCAVFSIIACTYGCPWQSYVTSDLNMDKNCCSKTSEFHIQESKTRASSLHKLANEAMQVSQIAVPTVAAAATAADTAITNAGSPNCGVHGVVEIGHGLAIDAAPVPLALEAQPAGTARRAQAARA